MATKLRVILFTDRVGSSIAAAEGGEAIRARVAQLQERFTREAAAEARGQVIKFLGDGHLLTFEGALDAVRAGLRLQQRVADHNAVQPEAHRFHLRVGMDAGDVAVDAGGDVVGHAADMAKRVEGEGEADCVFLTDRVRALLPPGKVEDEEVRAVTLKGDNHATTLYRVRGCAGEDPRAFRNPFLVGGPVMEPTDFYGREREVNSALARLQGMQSVSVVGPRRIGKSSLLHYLLHVLPDQLGPDYRTVFIDLLHPRARSVAGVLGEIQRQLGLEHPADTLAEFAGRMDRLHREGVRPVIALDELEVFVRLCAEFSEEFCEALRALASDRQLALLTASRAPLRELHDQGALVSPWYNIMGLVRLGPFTADEAREFVTAPRAGVAFTAEQVEAILQRGAGHPLCLQSYCWHAAQTNHAERTDWAAVWQEAADEIDQMLAGQ